MGELTLYHGCWPVVDHQFGRGGAQTPIEAIIYAVAADAFVDPLELPPIHEFIDPDAVNALFQRSGSAVDAETTLCFRMNNWNVFVRADGRIRVCDGTQTIEPRPIFESTQH